MGSKRTPTLYKLVFDEDTAWPGLEVTVRSMSIRKLREMNEEKGAEESEDQAFQRLCRTVGAQLVSWNREDEDGAALPPTLESLEDEEPALLWAIVAQWNQAMTAVPAPLESGSDSGGTSPVELALAEIPSESLAS